MLFNSLDFAIFLPIVFGLYWLINRKQLDLQNVLLVISSYVFYGFWDYRFLILIFLSTVVDYSVGLQLNRTEKKSHRTRLLWMSIIVNIGLLGFFKYYNFFVDNFVEAFRFFGQEISPSSLSIILPVGISFYTFQTLSYTIDIYRKKLEPTKDFVAFSAFVSFFPQLVAGPIERASNLLPQFLVNRRFDYTKAVDGLRQILWGLFKKVVIADNCAQYVNIIFESHSDYSASTLLVGAIFFSFQIYGDFSGYSDIAIGTAKLFGFNLKQNFAFPYFSRDIAEFWRRWHMSLTSWFRDYIYIPLGGSRGRVVNQIRNVFIIFIISGFWHGANWTFIVWGILNALYFLPLLMFKTNRNNLDTVADNRHLPSLKEMFQMALTFGITVIAWIFFRAETVSKGFDYTIGLLDRSLFSIPEIRPTTLFIIILVFIAIEWFGRKGQYAIEHLWLKQSKYIRWLIYYIIAMSIFLFGGKAQDFIYFQF